MPFTLTVLDTASIQSYIFGSNELRENIGASELVYRATKLWAFEGLDKLLSAVGGQHNIEMQAAQADKAHVYDDRFHIEDQRGPAAEVLYAGGGNTVVLFGGAQHESLAKDFVYSLSRRLLQDAPGLNLYAAHEVVPALDQADKLIKAIKSAHGKLAQLKAQLPGPTPLLGLSVTSACTSTGLPANGPHPDQDKTALASLASAQVQAKWKASGDATHRLREQFKGVLSENQGDYFEWTDDLDKIGNIPGRGESYIAIVHADGNGMGARILALNDRFQKRPARKYIEAMRVLSISVQETARNALCETLGGLVFKMVSSDELLYHSEYDEVLSKERHYLPFRPIVFGGDDVTWVCAGPWGLSLAHQYLAALEKQPLEDSAERKPPYACAGVTIVKTHYPFSRAYNMSEDLLKSAKRRVLALVSSKMASAIDWHVTTTGLSGDLDDIRDREYEIPNEGRLVMRPLLLEQAGSDYGWRTWENYYHLLIEFHDRWADQRNKIHALREALRGGRRAVQQFETIYLRPRGQRLPELSTMPEGYADGWVSQKVALLIGNNDCKTDDQPREIIDSHCLYFDAIEMHDQFFGLT